MGQFSWLDCKNKKYPIRDNVHEPVYVLVPQAFSDQYGGKIMEECYDGYGRFGGYDIYELVAEFNRVVLCDRLGFSDIAGTHDYEPGDVELDQCASLFYDARETLEDMLGLWSFERDELAMKGVSHEEIEKMHLKEKKEQYSIYCTE